MGPISLFDHLHLCFQLRCLLIPLATISLQMIFQESQRVKHFGIQRKPLPLEPSVLLREANRRRASLSAGNVFEMFDGHPNAIDG